MRNSTLLSLQLLFLCPSIHLSVRQSKETLLKGKVQYFWSRCNHLDHLFWYWKQYLLKYETSYLYGEDNCIELSPSDVISSYVYPTVRVSLLPSVGPFVHLAVCPLIRLSYCPFISVNSVSVSLFICLFFYPSSVRLSFPLFSCPSVRSFQLIMLVSCTISHMTSNDKQTDWLVCINGWSNILEYSDRQTD
jgi:hypothetical protein